MATFLPCPPARAPPARGARAALHGAGPAPPPSRSHPPPRIPRQTLCRSPARSPAPLPPPGTRRCRRRGGRCAPAEPPPRPPYRGARSGAARLCAPPAGRAGGAERRGAEGRRRTSTRAICIIDGRRAEGPARGRAARAARGERAPQRWGRAAARSSQPAPTRGRPREQRSAPRSPRSQNKGAKKYLKSFRAEPGAGAAPPAELRPRNVRRDGTAKESGGDFYFPRARSVWERMRPRGMGEVRAAAAVGRSPRAQFQFLIT